MIEDPRQSGATDRSNPQRVCAKDLTRICHLLSYGGGFPRKIHLGQIHKEWSLQIMVWAERCNYHQALSRTNKTWQGHERNTQVNLRLTKNCIKNEITETSKETFPSDKRKLENGDQDKGEKPLTCVFHLVNNVHDEMYQIMYTDQTGIFPVCLYRGIGYVIVLI